MTDGTTPLALDSEFDSNITEYTARAGNTVASVTVSATVNDAPGAKVDIRPTDQIPPENDEDTNHDVYLNPGANTVITVTVTAEDRSTNTYTVTVYQERVNTSDNDNLSALSLSGVSLSPRFSSGTTEYNARGALRRPDGDRRGHCRGYWGYGHSRCP